MYVNQMFLLLNSFLPRSIRGSTPGGGEGERRGERERVQENWHAHACESPKMNVDCHIWKDGHIRRNISVNKKIFIFF